MLSARDDAVERDDAHVTRCWKKEGRMERIIADDLIFINIYLSYFWILFSIMIILKTMVFAKIILLKIIAIIIPEMNKLM